MDKKIIRTDKAPAAIGPYSQAVRVGEFVFCSGQLGIDPATGQLVAGVAEQTRRALENARVILESQQLSLANVVKTTVYLVDMNQFTQMNAAYAESFPFDPPARSTIQVVRLPKDARVEIEVIAHA